MKVCSEYLNERKILFSIDEAIDTVCNPVLRILP